MKNRTCLLIILFLIGILPFQLNGIFNPVISDNVFVFWIAEVFIWFILPIVILLFGLAFEIFTPRETGLGLSIGDESNREKNIISMLVLFFVLPPVLFMVYSYFYDLSEILFPINYGEVDFSYKSMMPRDPGTRFLVSVYLSVTAGIVEEFYYRGILFTIFRDLQKRDYIYILVSSLIFASVHWEGGVRNLFAALVFGITCSVIYVRIRNIWPLAFGHFVVDYILFIR